MRATAIAVQTGSMQRKLRSSIGVLLVAVLIAALAPLSPAQAETPMPWNQPGSAWQGTIETKINHTYNYPQSSTTHFSDEVASYTELEALSTTADGSYGARVVGSGWQESHGPCYYTKTVMKTSRQEWTLDQQGPNPVSGNQDKIGLQTDDEGRTFFAPWYLTHIPQTQTNYCTGDGQPTTTSSSASNGSSKLGFMDGQSGYATDPLPDNDPDPLHLVGTRTWTLADPPINLHDAMSEYSFTVTYDLRLIDNRNCRPVNTSFIAHLGDADVSPHDMLRYTWGELEFCYGPEGIEVVSNGTQTGELLDTGALTTALDTLGQKFKYADSDPVILKPLSDGSTEAYVKGKFKFCTQIPLAGSAISKGIKKVGDIVPNWMRRKLLDWGAKRVFDSGLIPDWVKDKIIKKGINAVLNSLDNLSAAERTAFGHLVDKVLEQVSGNLVKLVLGDGKCFNVWEPEIVARLYPNGTFETFAQGPSGPFKVRKDF